MSFNVTSMCCITIARIPEQTSVGEGIVYVNVKNVDCYVDMKVRLVATVHRAVWCHTVVCVRHTFLSPHSEQTLFFMIMVLSLANETFGSICLYRCTPS